MQSSFIGITRWLTKKRMFHPMRQIGQLVRTWGRSSIFGLIKLELLMRIEWSLEDDVLEPFSMEMRVGMLWKMWNCWMLFPVVLLMIFDLLQLWQRAQHTPDVVSILSEIWIGTGKNDSWIGIWAIDVPIVIAAAAAASGANFKLTYAFNLEVLITGIFSATVECNHAGRIAEF